MHESEQYVKSTFKSLHYTIYFILKKKENPTK